MSEKISKIGVHVWKGLTEYFAEPKDCLKWVNGGIEGKVNVLRKLPKDNYVVLGLCPATETHTEYFQKQIEELKECGLDIDEEDSKYDFETPLLTKDAVFRRLIIFRKNETA